MLRVGVLLLLNVDVAVQEMAARALWVFGQDLFRLSVRFGELARGQQSSPKRMRVSRLPGASSMALARAYAASAHCPSAS